MRKMTRVYGMGILLLAISMLLMTGCCARLQSPIVFDSCCGGYSGCGYGGGCGQQSYCNSCSPCGPAPCDPSYR
jgi:hypothetical protein